MTYDKKMRMTPDEFEAAIDIGMNIQACLSSMANLCTILECDNVAREIIKDDADEIIVACNNLLDSVQS